MRNNIAFSLLASIAVLSFCAWRYRQPPTLRAHAALLYDRSESMPEGCDDVVALGQRALALPHIREGSTLAFFATGDQKTGLEPLLVNIYSLPVSRLATESNKRLVERQQAFLADLRKRCSALPSARISPLVQSLKQVSAHLAILGDNRTVRYLLARTDLHETVDPPLRRALNERRGITAPAVTINNDGIGVVICGIAEISAPGATTTDRIKQVWAPLFSQSDLVQFQPYCSQLPVQLDALP